MWILFLLLHLVGLVGYSLLLRKSLLAKTDPWVMATIMQTAIAIPMVFLLFAAPPSLDSYDIVTVIQIIITTLLVICFHFTNVQALTTLEASTYSILCNLRIIFATILGIVFLGEPIVPLQICGGLLIFLAVLTLRQKGKKQATLSGIKWGIGAAIAISVLNLFDKLLITQIGIIDYGVPVMLLAATIMWIVLFAKGKRVSLRYFTEPKTISLMVLRAMSAYGFALALSANGLLSVTTYVSSLSVIIIVLLGIWLLKEHDYLKQKIIATLLAVAGLTVIFIANIK